MMPNHLLSQIPGRAYLLLAVLIFATANPVSSKLTELGMQHLIHGRNPISLCNVLFVGNLCALALLTIVHAHGVTLAAFRQISPVDWLGMLVVAIVGGALAPALFFMALNLTPVNNVILIGRLEPPLILLILLLSVLLLRERVNSWVIIGSIVAFIGVALTIVLPIMGGGSGLAISRGDWMTAVGAASAAVATVISKARLQIVPLGIFNLFRVTVGTVIFFIAAVQLFGFEHFSDVASPFLWQWMLVYSAVIIVGGQLAWFLGLRSATAADVSLVSSFSPIAGILSTYAILGDVPTIYQYIGGAVIVVGIVLNQIGTTQFTQMIPPKPASACALDEVGYKGI